MKNDIELQRTNGCPSRVQLSTWHDGEGEEEVGNHLKTCESCTTVVGQYREIDDAVSAVPGPSPELIRRIRVACAESERPVFTLMPGLRVAAGFILVLAIAASFVIDSLNDGSDQQIAQNRSALSDPDGNTLRERTVVVKLGDGVQPLYGPRQINHLQTRPASNLMNAQLVSSGSSAGSIAMQRSPNLPIVIGEEVRHVWVVDNLEDSKSTLLELLPEGTRAQVCKDDKEDKTTCLTLWLAESDLQILVNRLADKGWALVSSSFPQPGESERIITTGREVQYTCDLIAQ